MHACWIITLSSDALICLLWCSLQSLVAVIPPARLSVTQHLIPCLSTGLLAIVLTSPRLCLLEVIPIALRPRLLEALKAVQVATSLGLGPAHTTASITGARAIK